MVSVIVFYFTTAAPVIKIMMGGDPMSPERVAERRAAVLDFITAALFVPGDSREPNPAGEGVRLTPSLQDVAQDKLRPHTLRRTQHKESAQ